MSEVKWQPWPWDERYMLSSDGQVRGPRRLLIPWPSNTDSIRYLVVNVGRRKQQLVHVMVCEAFHGARPEGKQAAHRNGDHLDNRAENLRWRTPVENQREKVVHGTQQRGEGVWCARLTEGDVRAIRAAAAGGATKASLGRRFGVSPPTISRIVSRRKWKHVQ